MDAKLLEAKTTSELRAMVRAAHDNLKGAVGVMMVKQECIDVLTGTTSPAVILKRVQARLSGQAAPTESEEEETMVEEAEAASEDDALPAEGVHGEGATSSGEPVVTIESLVAEGNTPEEAKVMLDAQRKIAKMRQRRAAEEAARKLAEEEAKKSATQMLSTGRIVPANGATVDFCGLTLPVIGHKDRVPKLDERYSPQFWRSQIKCGPTVFEQDVRDMARLLLAGMTTYLNGPRGCGKTAGLDYLAAIMEWGMIRVQGNKDMSVDDFVGTMQAGNGSTFFQPGPLVEAMEKGYILQLDEVDRFPADCTDILHAVLENNATGNLVITIAGGKTVVPHKNFRIVATANTAGFGDESGLHPNARVQDAAFIDRFSALFYCDYPERKDEEALIAYKLGITNNSPKRTLKKLDDITPITRDIVKAMTELAQDTRAAAQNQNMLYPLSTRQLLNWVSASQVVGISTAFATTILAKMPPQDQTVLAELAQRHLASLIGGAINTTPTPAAP